MTNKNLGNTYSVSKLRFPCVCVFHRGKLASWWTGDYWSKIVSLILSHTFRLFWILLFWFFGFWGSLQTILLFTMEELVGGGSAAVVVGFSDRWHATCDTHINPNTWWNSAAPTFLKLPHQIPPGQLVPDPDHTFSLPQTSEQPAHTQRALSPFNSSSAHAPRTRPR